MRLQGTVVRDKIAKQLVRVSDIKWRAKEFVAIVCKLGVDEDLYIVPLGSLNLSSPPLGNIDCNGDTYYIARLPKRRDWRQGLRKDNLICINRGRMFGYPLGSLEYLNLPVYNKYKSYRKILMRGWGSFSRDFSLDMDKKIWYKGREKVGKDINGVPVLFKRFTWLKEALDDVLVER